MKRKRCVFVIFGFSREKLYNTTCRPKFHLHGRLCCWSRQVNKIYYNFSQDNKYLNVICTLNKNIKIPFLGNWEKILRNQFTLRFTSSKMNDCGRNELCLKKKHRKLHINKRTWIVSYTLTSNNVKFGLSSSVLGGVVSNLNGEGNKRFKKKI